MRTANSIKNISISLISQMIFILFGFVTRKIFLENLGTEYLGINGLLTNVIAMLGLAEMGIGGSITYSLYKPLAEKNEEKIIALVQLYKKLYVYIATVVLILSLGFYPFLGKLAKESISIKYMSLIYFIFVGRNIISYLYAYKWAIISADQKEYLLGRSILIFQIIVMILRIFILSVYKNYLLFLCVDFIFLIIQNIYNGKMVEKLYPYITTEKKYQIDEEIKDDIKKNVKALFLHSVGSYCVFGTDNLLISYFINVSTVGLYSNYTMLIAQINNLTFPIFGGLGASIGNMLASESQEKSYRIFKVVYFTNFFIYSLATIFLFNLVEPFISWWLGKQYILDSLTFFVIMFNFYIGGLGIAVRIFKGKAGIFTQDKYMPIIESFINLVASIILVKYYGLAGIFMGTTISSLLVVFWTAPYMIYKNLFTNYQMAEYFKKYFLYWLITIIVGTMTSRTIDLIFEGKTLISLIGMGITSIIFPGTIYLIIFFKTEELKYLYDIVKILLKK